MCNFIPVNEQELSSQDLPDLSEPYFNLKNKYMCKSE